MGTLSLALRSIADSASEMERAVASGDVKVPAGANPAEEKKYLLSFANRPMDKNTTYTTGGDVSRFQRRTVPGRAPEPGLMASAPAAAGAASAASIAAVPTGPVVRVARGNTVTLVPVGGR